MIELVRPTVDLADSWWQMVDAFGDEQIHGSGLRPDDPVRLRAADVFEQWVDWLGQAERSDLDLPEGRVPSSYRWIVDDARVVGTIAVRHALTPALLVTGGHIGYAVEPGSRGRGVATAALRLALGLAAARGIDPALVTCDADNVASARTIARAGGVLEDERAGSRRYWVPTHAPMPPLTQAPVETPAASLVVISRTQAETMLAGGRLDWFAPGYPREDDLDALRMKGEPSAWSPRHIVRRSDGLAVGSIGCFGPPSDGCAEIGYGLVEQARGSGLMTEAVSGICRAVEAHGIRVTAHTEPDNTASQRVLRRLGFAAAGTDEGELRWERPLAQPVPRDGAVGGA